jgi:hypothetical protein
MHSIVEDILETKNVFLSRKPTGVEGNLFSACAHAALSIDSLDILYELILGSFIELVQSDLFSIDGIKSCMRMLK